MTRLRLAPSSPQRIVAHLRRLDDWVCWRVFCQDSSIDCRRGATELLARGARLLLRWFADGRVLAARTTGVPGFTGRALYMVQWQETYPAQRWPCGGAKRLRKELGE